MRPADLADHALAECAGAQAAVYGADQPEYIPLPALVFPDGKVMTEWELDDDERARVARGERIRLWIWRGTKPLQPVALEVTSEDRG